MSDEEVLSKFNTSAEYIHDFAERCLDLYNKGILLSFTLDDLHNCVILHDREEAIKAKQT